MCLSTVDVRPDDVCSTFDTLLSIELTLPDTFDKSFFTFSTDDVIPDAVCLSWDTSLFVLLTSPETVFIAVVFASTFVCIVSDVAESDAIFVVLLLILPLRSDTFDATNAVMSSLTSSVAPASNVTGTVLLSSMFPTGPINTKVKYLGFVSDVW